MHCFRGDGRVMRLHQVEELAPDVRHAWRFLNRTAFVKLVEASEGVGLQDALELGQMPLRMFALAVGRVGEPYSRRCLVACRTVVANIGPEAAGLGLAGSRRKHWQRSIVAVQLVRRQHIAAQNLGHRRQQRRGFTYPAGKNRTIQLDAFARKNL